MLFWNPYVDLDIMSKFEASPFASEGSGSSGVLSGGGGKDRE